MEDMILAKDKGFDFGEAEHFITDVAKDAALITTPNNAVPAELVSFISPKVIEIMTAPLNVRKGVSEVKMGDWTTTFAQFHFVELTGVTTPYADYDAAGQASVNVNWPVREQYVFETTIKVGDREYSRNSKANLNLTNLKQQSAAKALDITFNKVALYGCAGKVNYGFLNDPNLNAAIVPESVGGSTLWSAKTAEQIYTDIQKLDASLRSKSAGHIDGNSKMVMFLCPEADSQMDKLNTYGISVRDMLNKKFAGGIKFVVLPELEAATGNTVVLMAEDIMGAKVAEIGFGEKYHAHQVIRTHSSFEQKVSAGCYGTVIYYPFAIARMTGL